MAFPEDHENLNAADAAAPATRQSTSWAANIYGVLVKVVAAVKSVGAQTKANKATIEAHDSSIATKAEDDFSNIDTPEATKNLLTGPLSQSDIGKTIKLRGTVAAPELVVEETENIEFSGVLYTGWEGTYLPRGGTRVESRVVPGLGNQSRCVATSRRNADALQDALISVPNAAVVVGAEQREDYAYTGRTSSDWSGAVASSCGSETRNDGHAVRIKYRTYTT